MPSCCLQGGVGTGWGRAEEEQTRRVGRPSVVRVMPACGATGLELARFQQAVVQNNGLKRNLLHYEAWCRLGGNPGANGWFL